jgi:hypothetical protein
MTTLEGKVKPDVVLNGGITEFDGRWCPEAPAGFRRQFGGGKELAGRGFRQAGTAIRVSITIGT